MTSDDTVILLDSPYDEGNNPRKPRHKRQSSRKDIHNTSFEIKRGSVSQDLQNRSNDSKCNSRVNPTDEIQVFHVREVDEVHMPSQGQLLRGSAFLLTINSEAEIKEDNTQPANKVFQSISLVNKMQIM